mgnify:CR=1 FL=1
MSKFHINKNGVPAPCRAKEGNCPYGGSDSHYDTYEEAQKAATAKLESEHGLLATAETKNPEYEAKIDEVFTEVAKYLEKMDYDSRPDYDEFSREIEAADDLVRKYFKAKIEAKKEGKDLDEVGKEFRGKFDTPEVDKDSFYSIEPYGEADFREVWTSSSEDAYNEALMEAEKVEDYYYDRLDFTDEAIYMVEQVDWTKYGVSQREGEIEALEYMYENDLTIRPADFT